jgi:hypothetical protein
MNREARRAFVSDGRQDRESLVTCPSLRASTRVDFEGTGDHNGSSHPPLTRIGDQHASTSPFTSTTRPTRLPRAPQE